MYRRNGAYIYSPSDLITFLECEYVSWLNRYDKEFPGALPRDPDSEEDEMLRSSGDKHERRHLASLKRAGKNVRDLTGCDSIEATRAAMAEGAEIIYQAYLADGEFAGYADFLKRVPGRSIFGPYQYEVWDTKLAQHMKPYFAVQLCCYAEMLEAIQGVLLPEVGIILGNGREERLRTQDYLYYYRALKGAFLEQQRSFDPKCPPDIPPHGEFRHWTGYVEALLEERDDLSRVAGIRALQIKRLHEAGIDTMAALAKSKAHVPRIPPPVFERLRNQARMQIASRNSERPKYHPLRPDPGQPRTGLAALPPASPGDVYFDMEGYPLVEGGLEYLFGACCLESGRLRFRDWWAHDRDEERQAFEGFGRWAHNRWRRDPGMHIYHYASYEKAALRKLMGRFGACEAELDALLRNEVFVDLYSVVRQGLIVGEPSYSLKNIERLYLEERTGEVATASDSIIYYHRWREKPDGRGWRESETLRLIRDYNREDCESAAKLAEWLRGVQSEQGIAYIGKAEDEIREISEAAAGRAEMAQQMVAKAAAIKDPERRRIQELLAWLLEYHRREQKPAWWALFERHAMTEQELVDDPDCLGGLKRVGRPELVKRSLRYTYKFDPHQETKLREESNCCFAHDIDTRVTLESIDFEAGKLSFKMGCGRPEPPERLSLLPYEFVSAKIIADSIERLVKEYRDTGELPRAFGDFLERRAPRLKGRRGGPVIRAGVPVLEGAVDAALALNESTLAVQGPPGCGKTYTAARMIAALVKAGKRVAVTSNSHRAISLLLAEAGKACREARVAFSGANVVGPDDEAPEIEGFKNFASGRELFESWEVPQIVGGTAWVFSNQRAEAVYDYLFVDEAGQASVANLAGMAACASNIVLFGDQRQLNQPVQGSHPGESGTSILEYLLGDMPTVPPDKGIFLPGTWRMRPELCAFISDAIYEGRVEPEPVTLSREILRDGRGRALARTAGLLYIPVEHEGNVYECEEEAEAIERIVHDLLKHGYRDGASSVRRLSREEILVVSPYNLQVRLLRQRLPGLRVGTVDKFQGQEAPAVIYSMTSSSGDACPRGLDFLFNPNRLNVALSRAQVLAIVVASPQLMRTKCSRLEQMRLVNLFCRAVEAGTVTTAAAMGIN